MIIFTVNNQKITHDLGNRIVVAGSEGIVQAAFTFDASWEGFDVVVVFTNSGRKYGSGRPVRYTGEPIDIPPEVLVAGKLYVSVIGFGPGEKRKTTQKWDIQQAITVQPCGALGGCDLLRSIAQGGVSEENIATDPEVESMLNDVFGGSGQTPDDPSGGETSTDDAAPTDEGVNEMLTDVFGS